MLLRPGLDRRLAATIPVMVVALVVFGLLRLTPGDPAAVIAGGDATPDDVAKIRARLGLDQPLHVQLGRWFGNLLPGDLGTSIFSGLPPVTTLIMALPAAAHPARAHAGLRLRGADHAHDRAGMLSVLREDYIRTATAKGLPPAAVLLRHALKNAGLPVVTIIDVGVALLIGGVVVTESLFALPGIGRLTVDAILRRDYRRRQH